MQHSVSASPSSTVTLSSGASPNAHAATPSGTRTSSAMMSFSSPLHWSMYTLQLKAPLAVRNMTLAPSDDETTSPLPLEGHSMSAIPIREGEFVIFGGFHRDSPQTHKGVYHNNVYILSMNSKSLALVTTTGDRPSERAYHGGATYGKTLVVWGGHAPGMTADDSLYFLDLGRAAHWQGRSEILTARFDRGLELDPIHSHRPVSAIALWSCVSGLAQPALPTWRRRRTRGPRRHVGVRSWLL